MESTRLSVVLSILLSALVSSAVAAQTSPPQTPKKSASGPSPTLTPQQREAQKHYRIALEAIKNNDFATASDELKAAADLAPKNALIWYNLAIVESKKGDSKLALEHLQKAKSLGLPRTVQNDAESLEAKLSYEVRRRPGSSNSEASAEPPQKGSASYDDTVHYIQERLEGGLQQNSVCHFHYIVGMAVDDFNAAALAPHVSWYSANSTAGSINCAGGASCVLGSNTEWKWDFSAKTDTDKSKMEKALLHLLDLCGVSPPKPDLF